jgi:HK97 family phage prohead protease
MERKTKHLHLNVKATGDDGSFEGYGSVFGNVDSYGDIVDKGAFTKTLHDRGNKVKLLWQHDSTQPIGVFTSLSEDSVGLKFTGQLNLDVQKGAEAYSLLKQGALDGMSIGYCPIQWSVDSKDASITHLNEVMLFEISLVTFPANEEATVSSVKDRFDTLNNEQRKQVLALINKFNPSLPVAEPPTTEASEGKHSVEEVADKETVEEPQEELIALHSLANLLEDMKSFAVNKEVKQ